MNQADNDGLLGVVILMSTVKVAMAGTQELMVALISSIVELSILCI